MNKQGNGNANGVFVEVVFSDLVLGGVKGLTGGRDSGRRVNLGCWRWG